MDKAEKKGVNLMLPVGSIVAREFKNDTEYKYVPSDAMPDGWMGMDLGSLTIERFSKEIKKAKTIVWNGPMGVFEFPNFATGTREIARAVAESGAVSIVGGGDSAAAIEQLGFANRITHISTGGGASLEFLEGKVLPGIAVIADKNPRKKLIAGNWKMYKTPSEAVAFVNELKGKLAGASSEVAVCVPYVCIPAVVEALKDSGIAVGAQDMYWEDSGAYTGEVSGPMLKDAGVNYVIIGHSERRQYFGEIDETVNKKVHAAFKAGLVPIICVGETLEQRERGITADLVNCQVKLALYGLSAAQAKQVVIAYEPVWAIGTGKTATSEQANEVCAVIRETLEKLYDEQVAETVRILYGGSIKPYNAGELFTMSDIDGGLVGGASLKADSFEAIVKFE
jgi:triosephosphate isomerase